MSLYDLLANTSPPTLPTEADTVSAKNLSAEAIAGIVLGTVMFIGLIATVVTLCVCCLTPTCPCYYYKRSRIARSVVVTHQTPQVAMTTSSTKTTKYQPPPVPTYDNDTGYQPYPAALPAATTAKH